MSLFFTVFSFHLPNFGKNWPVFSKNRSELATPVFRKNRPHFGETSRISVFPVFTVPPSSPVRFSRIFPIFTDFCRFFFQKPTGLRSNFPCSAEFLNTARTPELGGKCEKGR
jgi:hypothetical protein